MNVYFSGLQDLFNDWLAAIPEIKVSLRKLKIYRIKNIKERGEKTKADVMVTDVWTMKQRSLIAIIPSDRAEQLEHAGVFYKTEDMRFIPSDEVQGHIFNDYFHIPARRMDEMEEEELEAADLELASKFRKMGQIIFIARKPVRGYAELVGMKSACTTTNRVRTVDIAGCFMGNFEFSSSYPEQDGTQPSLEFEFECRNPEWRTADGTPYWLSFSDTATGRRSIRVDLVAGLHGRKYIIDCMEVSHRSSAAANVVAEKVLRMAEQHLDTRLNPSVEAQTISENCLKFIPKKTRKIAMDSICAHKYPIAAAYDAMGSGLFNPRQKQHRTWGYDGGRRKYELALGYALRCC